MIGNYKLEAQKKHPKYGNAKSVAEGIVKKLNPNEYANDLKELFGDDWPSVSLVLNSFFKSEYTPGKFRGPHESPIILTNIRSEITMDTRFVRMHNSLRNNQMPEDEVLNYFFGSNKSYIKRQLDELSFVFNLQRQCKLKMTMHYSRNTGVMNKLMESPEYKGLLIGLNREDANTIAFQHDLIENYLLLILLKMPFEKFFDKYVNPKIFEHIMRITNKRDIVLKYVKDDLENNNYALTRQNLEDGLRRIGSGNLYYLKDSVRSVLEIMASNESVNNFDEIKWLCYPEYSLDLVKGENRKLIKKIGVEEIRKYFVDIIAKYIDHGDNVHGNEDLSLDSRIKSVVKRGITGDSVHSLEMKIKP
ncbi:hypothetical protein J4399_03510, partial [Candidatus Woesearchaeota archaeon]|nr:hypothetical protein [Candidatus Woesearchaeota archaeon]